MADRALAGVPPGASVRQVILAGGWLDWLGSNASERRLAVFLVVVGLIASGTVVHAATRSHRARLRQRRRKNPPTTPRYVPEDPPTRHAPALGVGALLAVAAGEPVNTLAYGRSRRAVRAGLVDEIVGERDTADRSSAAREALPRTLNSLLGARAEVIGDGLRFVEEVLRRRALVGPDLWRHDLDEFAGKQGLVLTDRVALLRAADEVEQAEERLRAMSVLGQDDRVPTLLACHWADGVHLVRGAWRVGWLDPADALAHLERAGHLVRNWYPSWPAVLGALLLPDLLAENDRSARWNATVAGHLLTDPRSPLATALEPSASADRGR